MKYFISLLAALCFSSVAIAAKTPKDIIQDLSRNAEKAIKLPNTNSVVLFDKNSDNVLVIAKNPRWVVKGELYDMFQNKQILNTRELKQASNKIPFKKIGVDTVNILSFTTNKNKEKSLVVFIDPFSESAAKDIEVISYATKEYRVRYILAPFVQSSFKKIMQFSCNVYKESSEKLIQRIKVKQYGLTDKYCHQDLVNKTYGLTAFLGLKSSPTLIASNNTASFGMPVSIVTYLAKNME